MKKRDSMHYTTRSIDGFNAPFNFIISAREAGKSTAIWLDKVYKAFITNNQTSLILRRKTVHITDKYISDIANIINKFTDDNVILNYNKGAKKDGLVDVYIDDKPFITIVSLSADITAVKSTMIPNLRYIIFDEFICNPKFQESYLKGEVDKFKDIYNTYQRESDKLTTYFLGNPYSLFNPYFMNFGIDSRKLHPGAIVFNGKNAVCECYELTDELKSYILEHNPLYKFDDSYTRYAFNGEAINDVNIPLIKQKPNNFKLQLIFKNQEKYIAVFRNNFYLEGEFKYYAEIVSKDFFSKKRDVFVFDFEELVEGSILLDSSDKIRFQKIKDAIRKRLVAFNTIECYYLIVEVYKNI